MIHPPPSLTEGPRNIVQLVPVITGPGGERSTDLFTEPLLHSTPENQPEVRWGANLTDSGNAYFFASRHSATLRYCHTSGRWLVWDRRRWWPDENESVIRLAKQTLQDMYQATLRIPDLDLRKRVIAHLLRSEAEKRLRSMISLAKSEPAIAVTAKDLDRDPMLLNCQNGTINLATGVLQAHRREDLITKLVPVEYLPEAKSPVFEAFLSRAMANNGDLIRYLQRAIGYALTASIVEEAIFFLFGPGANGKTTFLEAIRKILGDYAGQVPIETLMKKQSDAGIPNDIAMLNGWRFVTSSETEEGHKLASSKIKYLTSNAPIQARFLHREFFRFLPSHKIFMDTNHKPEVRGDDDGIWRRIKTIPFTVTVPRAERDPELGEKLARELPGILAWAVRGCLDWHEQGLAEPKDVSLATSAYRGEMDTGAIFLLECCELGLGFQEPTRDLYRAYLGWCDETGEQPISTKAFGAMLTRQEGVTQGRDAQSRHWKGVRIKPTADGSATE